jgi:hypothetical protein
MTPEQWFQLGLVAIGAIGTVVGSLLGALGGALYHSRLTRPRFEVRAKLGFAVIGGQPSPAIVTLTAANVGPLPMQVVACGFALSGGMSISLTQDALGLARLPVDLQPGHAAELRIFYDNLREGLQEQADTQGRPISVVSAWARDGTGREWRGKVFVKNLVATPSTASRI